MKRSERQWLIALVVGALLQALNGAFLQNTVTANINPFDSVSLAQNLFIMAIFQAGPLLMALVLLWRPQGLYPVARR